NGIAFTTMWGRGGTVIAVELVDASPGAPIANDATASAATSPYRGEWRAIRTRLPATSDGRSASPAGRTPRRSAPSGLSHARPVLLRGRSRRSPGAGS